MSSWLLFFLLVFCAVGTVWTYKRAGFWGECWGRCVWTLVRAGHACLKISAWIPSLPTLNATAGPSLHCLSGAATRGRTGGSYPPALHAFP